MVKTRSAVKTVGTMMAVTAASKLLGMVRQMLFGSVFAESVEASAFLAASSVSLSLFDILFASAIAGCFIPMLGSAKRERRARGKICRIVYLRRFACYSAHLGAGHHLLAAGDSSALSRS